MFHTLPFSTFSDIPILEVTPTDVDLGEETFTMYMFADDGAFTGLKEITTPYIIAETGRCQICHVAANGLYILPVNSGCGVHSLFGGGGALECQGGIRLVQKFT